MDIKPGPPRPNSEHERHVVLVAPEVHWNTGNIGRTCLGAGASLHLIEPLGFSLGDKHVKRAGLDYWDRVKLSVWEDFQAFAEGMKPGRNEMALFSKNAKKSFWSMDRPRRLFLVFGSETRGLPPEISGLYPDASYHIPIAKDIRCLNLSTAVGIALYESIRDFDPPNQWTCDV
jgi:tRNA (cytidine/uridine-2'-O-)-methyltransferase